MKPNDILDAIDGISEKYITEAKPIARRRGEESRAKQMQTISSAETAGKAEKIRLSAETVQSRKERISMSSMHSVWQRAMTSVVAAAACAVFIGGGWFIVQQAKQSRQQESATYNENDINFLGGYGQVHIAGNMNLLYDDNNFYFRNASYQAERSGSGLGTMRQRPVLNDVYWDGEQFYRMEDTALYRIDNAGKHLDETPFFTINYNDYKEFFTDYEIDDSQFLEIQKLADGIYYLGFRLETPDDENNRTFGYLYQPADGHQELILCDNADTPDIAADDSSHAYMSCLLGDIFHITYSPYDTETISDDIHVKSYGTNWYAADGNIYFMVNDTTTSDNVGRHDYTPDSYGKINLATGQYTDIVPEPGFTNFIPFDGKIYALSDSDHLICADPEWTKVETICNFSSDLPKEIFNALPMMTQDQFAIPTLYAVDENYIQISCPFNQSAGCLLLDRKNGSYRFFTENTNTAPEETDADTNIFGGKGALHAAGSLALIYDDSNVYFDTYCGNSICGDRNTNAQISGTSEIYDERLVQISYDGKDLYTINGFNVYRLGQDGKPEAEPFYTVSDELFREVSNKYQEENDKIDRIYLESFKIERLIDDAYFVYLTFSNNLVDQGLSGRSFHAFLYNAATGKNASIPDYDNETTPAYVSTDGEAYYFKPFSYDGFCRLTLDPVNTERFDIPKDLYIEAGCGRENWFVQNQTAYYVSPGEDHSFTDVRYCKYDMKTKTCSVYNDSPDFSSFFVYDGMLYACNKAGTQIYCTDPELKNKTVLFDFEKDTPASIQEKAKTAVNNFGPLNPITGLLNADSQYICAELAGCSFMLLDRTSGSIRFYLTPDIDESVLNSESTQTASADTQTNGTQTTSTTATTAQTTAEKQQQNTDGNVFGGQGTLYPVEWDTHGETSLYRDDNYYYYYNPAAWFRYPIAGGQHEQLPARINGAPAPAEGFVSDGERVYARDCYIVSEGNAANSFNLSEVKAFMDNRNNVETDGYHYSLENIWHINNRYFILLRGLNNLRFPNDIELWTDENGKLLCSEDVSTNLCNYFCSNDKTEMYAVMNNELHVRFPAGEEDCRPDPLAYGAITDAYVDREHEFYITTDGKLYTRVNGQPVLISSATAENMQNLSVAPDGRFFYAEQNGSRFSLCEWKGEGKESAVLYESNADNEFIFPCGFERHADGSYYIVAYTWNNENYVVDRFLFIDPDNGQVVKELR